MEIAINCSIKNNFSNHYLKKHILMKKSTKNTFPGKKNTTAKKAQKALFVF